MLKVLYLKTVKTTRCVIVNFYVKYDMPSAIFGHCQNAPCSMHFDKAEYTKKTKHAS